jgi:UDP-N-acetyl-D-galactosamine dehydrogenase
MLKELASKQKAIAVIGLGYVGLPIALAFAKKFKVIGFDISEERVAMMKNGIDPSGELATEEFQGRDIHFTKDEADLSQAHFFIVAVPTPIDKHTQPDLRALKAASKTVGKAIKVGDYVVYESTVYPGCTEEDCVPIIEQESKLTAIKDFKIGYSPERINPGDKEHTLTTIIKVVSGCSPESLQVIADVYSSIVVPGVYKASSIKVAEAAKVIENTQRDLNIALMNELSLIFDKLKINTYEVLEAAGTKWNFLKFSPGLVGGHCIGVDPYYLTYKAKSVGYDPRIILSGRALNDNMGAHIAQKTVKRLIRLGKNVAKSKVLVLGATFKENVADIRNSKVADLVTDLIDFGINVHWVDPHASPAEVMHEYGIPLQQQPLSGYDAIILAVAHTEYMNLTNDYLHSLCNGPAVFIDVKGTYRQNKPDGMMYWSL